MMSHNRRKVPLKINLGLTPYQRGASKHLQRASDMVSGCSGLMNITRSLRSLRGLKRSFLRRHCSAHDFTQRKVSTTKNSHGPHTRPERGLQAAPKRASDMVGGCSGCMDLSYEGFVTDRLRSRGLTGQMHKVDGFNTSVFSDEN